MKAIQLKPTNLYSVELTEGCMNAHNVLFSSFYNKWYLVAPLNTPLDGRESLELPFDKTYDFIGEATKDKVPLPVGKYKPSHYIPIEKLLKDNGLFFTNPMGCKPDYVPVEPYSSKINETIYNDTCGEWDRAEDCLVKGKLLIFIKK